MLRLSVVVPARDDAAMLERCLQCLAEQLRPADEIIVVDNGSSDTTAAVAIAAGATLITEPLHGIWPAASAGYDAAGGDIIVRLDADSRAPADWLAHIEAEFVSLPDLDAVTGPGEFYDGTAIATLLGRVLYIGGYFRSMGAWLGQPPLFGSNFAMRRALWLATRSRVHRGERRMHDDLDLSLHLAPGTEVRYDAMLTVGISSRPFDTWRGLGRRLGWSYLTIRPHLPAEAPWRRRAVRRRWRREHRLEARGYPA